MAPQVSTWQLPGQELSVAEWGAGDDVVVLVHGIGVSRRYFTPLAEDLSSTHRVLALDLPGFGQSPDPSHGRVLSVEEMGEVVAALIRAAGVHRPVLVGHSMGSQVVTAAALSDPDAAGSLVLLGPVIEPGARSFARQAMRLARDARHERPAANAIMVQEWLRCGPRRYLATVPSMLAYPLEERLPDVDVPTLVVRGEHDPVAPRDYVERLAGLASDGRGVEVAGAGHIAMHRRPAVVADLCRTVRC